MQEQDDITYQQLLLPLGIDMSGREIFMSLKQMRHIFIAGQTGSGKSVFLNSIINSLLCSYAPNQLKLMLYDSNLLEFQWYAGIPHLILPVITDPAEGIELLNWAWLETKGRLQTLRKAGTRDIDSYNQYAKKESLSTLPYIVLIVGECSEILAAGSSELETKLIRLCQIGHNCGIHLIFALSVAIEETISQAIVASFPSKVVFRCDYQTSTYLLDHSDASQLFGNGDFLLRTPDLQTKRIQGVFTSDSDSWRLSDFWRHAKPLQSPPTKYWM